MLATVATHARAHIPIASPSTRVERTIDKIALISAVGGNGVEDEAVVEKTKNEMLEYNSLRYDLNGLVEQVDRV